MKRKYEAPMMSFEDFELSANIATTCGTPTGSPSGGTCSYPLPGVGNVFLDSIEACDYKGADGDYSLCYDVPIADNKLFNS